jgi:SPP1 family phage portal protein
MDYLEIIKGTDFAKIQEVFSSNKPKFVIEQATAIKQYKVGTHDIFDTTKRPKKTIKKDTGELNDEGDPVMATTQVEVARVAMPFQKIVVNRRVGFMLSDPVQTVVVEAEENEAVDELLKMIDIIQNNNKMDYKNKELARRLMSEMQSAEIWYLVENTKPNLETKFTLKVKVLSPDLGDTLLPLYDNIGDMIAFARAYKITVEGKDVEHYDIYTAEFEYKWVMSQSKWILDPEQTPNPVKNMVGKIMVVYYEQKEPEWYDVQTMIDRLETLISNHADIDDYFGSPILTVFGELLGYAQKGETGKVLQLTQGSQAQYLALASEPMSIKMEQENLERFIYAMSQTPNITFDVMKGLGNLSGVALKLLFLDAHMAVKNKEEIFGLGLQRRINILKAAIGKVIKTDLGKTADMTQLKPILTPYLPQNDTEMIENLSTSMNGGMMSRETAVGLNPLIEDAETELARMKDEQEEALALQAGMGMTEGGAPTGEEGVPEGGELQFPTKK